MARPASIPSTSSRLSVGIRNLNDYSQADFDAVAAELDGRPRKILGYMTPSPGEGQIHRGHDVVLAQAVASRPEAIVRARDTGQAKNQRP